MEIFLLKVCSCNLDPSEKEVVPSKAAAPLFQQGYNVVCLQGNFGTDQNGIERKTTVVLNIEPPSDSGGSGFSTYWNVAMMSFIHSAIKQPFWVASFLENAPKSEEKGESSLKSSIFFDCSDRDLPVIQIAGVRAHSGNLEVPLGFTIHRPRDNVTDFFLTRIKTAPENFFVGEGLCEKMGRLFSRIWSAVTYLFRPEITCEFGRPYYDVNALSRLENHPLAMTVMLTKESRISLIWEVFLGTLYRCGLLSASRLPISCVWKEHVRPRLLNELNLVAEAKVQLLDVTEKVSCLTRVVLKAPNQSVVDSVQELYKQDVVIASYNIPRKPS